MPPAAGTTKTQPATESENGSSLCSLSPPHPCQASQISSPIWILKDQLLQICVLYDRDMHSKVKSGADFWFLKKLFLKLFIFLQQIAKIWIPTLFWDHSDLNDLNICNPLTANTSSRPRCIPWYLKIVLELDSAILSIGCFLHNCGHCRNRGVICQTSVMNTFAGEEDIIKLMLRKY